MKKNFIDSDGIPIDKEKLTENQSVNLIRSKIEKIKTDLLKNNYFLIPKLTHVSAGNNRFYLGDDSHRITPTIG
ncbi:hypothetical protein [Aliivibrio fischeri]|uniref:Uncharacterized protein n=1 Tax=Aliivibrio fischeri SR5 TaxID=1088719 RepID=A0AAV3ERU3_ALIFS|nr:hypothetical protein [Aliivibrio fischeri]EHN69660.1 hypothetical protein VFSR5_1296 [Aliivibrio fischeri SR5]